jgi:hypothetical protein
MAASRLTRVAVRLVKMLGEGCAVVGGLAVNAYGYVRATRDVDIIVPTSLQAAAGLLEAHGLELTRFRGDPFEGDFPCVKGVLGGVPFDLLPPLVPIERSRLVVLELHGQPLPIVDFETLVRLKLKAGGPKDLLDVAMLVNLRRDTRETVLGLAVHMPDIKARLLSYIDDPRVRRDAAERIAETAMLEKKRGRRGTRLLPRTTRPRRRRAF